MLETLLVAVLAAGPSPLAGLGAAAYVPGGGGALSGSCVAYGALQLSTPPCPLLFALE